MDEVSLKLRRHCIEENSYYSVSSMYGFFIYMHFRFCHWWHSNFVRKCHWHSSGWQLIGNESHFIFWTSLPICYSCKRRNIKDCCKPDWKYSCTLKVTKNGGWWASTTITIPCDGTTHQYVLIENCNGEPYELDFYQPVEGTLTAIVYSSP